jgi:PAS domain S-box-containing protein
MSNSKPVRILYMEDDAGEARLFQKKLERLGYLVDIASNGDEGLAMYDAATYDVVAVDQRMPVLDGLEVIHALASRRLSIPMIMVSGSGDERIAVEAMKLGASDYIVKEPTGGYLELLPAVIEQVLDRRRLTEEKQQAEQALRQSEERYRLLAEHSLDLIGLLDLEGNILYASPSHFQVLGYKPAELRRENIFLFIYPDDVQPALSVINTLVSVGMGRKIEIRLQQKSGPWIWVEAILSVITDDTGLNRLLLSARDITERKRAEEALRQQTVELQARNEELDAFAHTVAHDLQAPLTTIVGFAAALTKPATTLPQEELQKHLQTIVWSGRKMSNIIKELLMLASVRQLEVELKPLDMAHIVVEVQQRLAATIETYKAQIILPEAWPAALGHAQWVEEVWVNYISNAIKYGGRPPRVELGATVQADGIVRFWVRDNGSGLTPAEQAQLFVPFIRLNKTPAKGNGLGLSIVRRIVEKLGGQVGVESEGLPERGCVFSFTLPGVPTLS